MLDAQYWSARYREGRTGWDLNAPSTPLIAFCESQVSKDDRILIPGAGRGYHTDRPPVEHIREPEADAVHDGRAAPRAHY